MAWPTQEVLDASNAELNEHLSNATKTIDAIHQSSMEQTHRIEKDAKEFSDKLDSFNSIIVELKTTENMRDDSIKTLKSDIEQLKLLIPKVIRFDS